MISGTGFANDGPASAVVVKFNGTPTQPGGLQIGAQHNAVRGRARRRHHRADQRHYGSRDSYVHRHVLRQPVPAGAAGSVGATGGYEYGSTPSIYGISPGKAKVGAHVKITGTSVNMAKNVYIGVLTAKAKFVVTSPTSLDVIVPKGANLPHRDRICDLGQHDAGRHHTEQLGRANSKAPTALTWSNKKIKITT